MSVTNQEKLKKLYKKLDEIEAYSRCLGKVSFDQSCCAPEDGLDQAGEDMALLSKHLHSLTHAKGYTELLCQLHGDSEGLTEIQKKAVEHLYDDYRKTKNVTPRFSYEYNRTANRAYADWLRAKQAGDFSLFRDSLETMIDFRRKEIALRDERYPSAYDACLDDSEKGLTIPKLDAFFEALKGRIVPLIRRIQAEGKPIRTDFLDRPVPVYRQEAMSRALLEREGLKKSSLVLMTTEHPFTTNFGPGDVRVTTHYYEENFISNIFSSLHEGGHAVFMQNEPRELFENHCSDRPTNAMHESISRFYENLIGRSEAFIHYIYPEIRSLSGGVFDDVSERELYEAVNRVHPGLIRTEADELSYCLHVLIRYELEKAFVNGEITVDQIPALWNAKYKEYLGVEVPNDAEGCLQDVHWTSDYGYFPSYALGSAYGAQILRAMERDFDVFAAVRAGELYRVTDWLTERVFSIASLSTPDQWIRAISGESLNVNYFLDYLEEKFTALYELN